MYRIQSCFNKLPRIQILRVYSEWRNSDIAFRWVHRESNLMFLLSSDKDRRKNFVFALCKWTLRWTSTLKSNHSKGSFALRESEHFLSSLLLFSVYITLNLSKSDVDFHACKCTLTPSCSLFSGGGGGIIFSQTFLVSISSDTIILIT